MTALPRLRILQTVTGDPSSVTRTFAYSADPIEITATATDGTNTFTPESGVEVTTTPVPPDVQVLGSEVATAGVSYELQLNARYPASDSGSFSIESWTIDWGDGNTETFDGSTASVSHTFASDVSSTIVSATATDGLGTYSPAPLIVAFRPAPDPIASASLSATSASDHATKLTWSASYSAPVTVERSQPGGEFKVVGTAAAGATTFDDVGLAPSQTYYYQINTPDGTSNIVSARTYRTGDVNNDGIVDHQDVAIAAADLGNTGAVWSDGDVDGNGVVNNADVDAVLSVEDQAAADPIVLASGGATALTGANYSLSLEYHPNSGSHLDHWTISWGDGSAPQQISGSANPTTVNVAHHFSAPGSYEILAVGTDGRGRFAAPSLTVAISNDVPSVTIGAVAPDAPVGAVVQYTSTVSEAQTSATFSYAWAVTQDETTVATSSASSLSFTPTEAGAYTIQLEVTDQDGEVGTASTSLTAKTTLFQDMFARSDSSSLGSDWTDEQGTFGISSDAAAATSIPSGSVAISTVNDLSQADVSVSASFALSTNPYAGESAGVVARGGSGSMYVGRVREFFGLYSAEILLDDNGTSTTLVFRAVTTNTGTLRFDVRGSALRLYVDGKLAAAATDETLSGAGSVGLYADHTDSTFGNFSVADISPASAESAELPFNDSFDANGSAFLSPQWTANEGDLAVVGDRVESTSDDEATATLNGVAETDVTVSADLNMAAATTSYGVGGGIVGLDARVSETGRYRAQIDWAGSSIVTASILLDQDGEWTTLASAPVNTLSGHLEFQLRGDSLVLLFNNRPLVSVVDDTLAEPGTVGIMAQNQGITIDNFAVGATPALPDEQIESLPFAHDFNGADGSPISGAWNVQQGAFSIVGGAASAAASGDSLATVNGITAADVSVSADIDLGSAVIHQDSAGLIARASGDGAYMGRIEKFNSSYSAQILQRFSGDWSVIASGPVPSGTGRLRFDLQGSKLALYFNDRLVASAVDHYVTDAGAVGIAASGPVTLDNFAVSNYASVAAESMGLPFSDNFGRSDVAIVLGADWTQQSGSLAISNHQVVDGGSGVDSLATVVGPSAADVVVSANVSIADSQAVGLVARCAEDGSTYYLGQLGPDGAEIWAISGGAADLLDSATVGQTKGSLRFEVIGDSLQLFLNDQVVASATDSTISDAGSVGIGCHGHSFGALSDFTANTPQTSGTAILAISSDGTPLASQWDPGVSLTDVVVGDFNGDGKQDIAGLDSATGNWLVGLSQGNGAFITQTWGHWDDGSDRQDVQVGDFNGDGLADIASLDSATGTLRVLMSNGKGFVDQPLQSWLDIGPSSAIFSGDFNGDHRTDALGFGSGDQLLTGDFNGDGRSDLALLDPSSGELSVALVDGTFINGFLSAAWPSSDTGYVDVHAGDFNGDGIADVIGRPAGSDSWEVSLSSGHDFDTQTWTTASNLADVHATYIDGDGKMDLVGRVDGTNDWRAEISTGSGFTDQPWLSYSSAIGYDSVAVGDFRDMQRSAAAAFQSVYNNIAFQPYAGAMKGADATEQTGAGNDWDQAALLIKKLTALGVQANYVSGQIDASATDVENWLGVQDEASALALLNGAGLNASEVTLDSDVAGLRFDHTWVQAYLPGAGGLGWRQMDPSLKFTDYQAGIDVASSVPFDMSGYLAHLQPGSATAYYESQVSAWLAANDPAHSIADVSYSGPIIAKSFSTVPDSLPFAVVGTPTVYDTVPSIMTHRVQISFGLSFFNQSDGDILKTFSVPDIALQTMTISWLTQPNGALIPQLLVGGVVVATGTEGNSPGGLAELQIYHLNPGQTSAGTPTSYSVRGGDDIAIGLNALQYSSQSIEALQGQVNQEASAYKVGASADPMPAYLDGLSLGIMSYVEQTNVQGDAGAGLLGVRRVETSVGDAIVYSTPNLEYHWDLNVPIDSQNTGINAPNVPVQYYAINSSMDADVANVEAQQLRVTTDSSLEAGVLEAVFNADAISAAKAIQWANDNSIPVYTIDSSNASTLLPELHVSTAVLGSIYSFVTGGDTVIVPRDTLESSTWSGSGFLVEDSDGAPVSDLLIGDFATHGGSFWGNIKEAFKQGFAQWMHDTLGDPVDASTGAVRRSDVDVQLPNAGPALGFARSYSSDNESDVGLGVGWTGTYLDTLTEGSDGGLTWNSGDGFQYVFTSDGDGGFVTPAGVYGTLTTVSGGGHAFTDTHGNVTTFNADGRLVSLTDRNDNALTLTYDESGQLSAVTDAADTDRQIDFTWSNGEISSVSDFTGRTWTYGYQQIVDSSGTARHYLTGVISPIDESTAPKNLAYTYYQSGPLAGLLQGITDPGDAGEIQFGYYPNRRAFSVTDPEGNTEHFNYDLFNNTTTHVDPLGHATQYQFNSDGLTSEVVNPDLTTTSTVWSGAQVTSITDPMGRTATFTYDDNGNVIDQTGFDGIETATTFDPTFNLPTEVTVAGVQTSDFAYDSNGNMLSATDALGDETTMTYTDEGLLETVTLPKGNVADPDGDYTTSFTYNDGGQVLTTVTGLPSTVTNTYDDAGNLLTTTDADGHTTSFGYDLLGRPLQTTGPDPDGEGPLTAAVSTVSYDPSQDEVTGTDPLGNATSMLTDRNNRVIKAVNADGTFSTNDYDAAGNLIASTDAMGNRTQYVYNAENRLIQTLYADGTSSSMSYNADGQVIIATDPNGNKTTDAYDAQGHLTSQTNPADQETSFTYDDLGNVETETDPTGTTTFTRDLLGRATQVRAPGGVIATTDYDPNGNVINQTNYDVSDLETIPEDPRTLDSSRQHTIATAYDVLDRPTEVTDAADNHSFTTYDAAGLVISTTDAAGATTTDGYDDAGRLTSQTGPDPDGEGEQSAPVTSFAYDADNNLVSETDPLNQTTSYAYDKMNQLVSVTQLDPDGSGDLTAPVTRYAYDPDGRQTSITDPDGNNTFYAYNSVGQEAAKFNELGSKWSYLHDGNGNVLSTTDADGRTTTYTYNSLNQVTSENWINSDGVTIDRTITYTYNDKNQLESVSDPDSAYAYTYNDAGQVLTTDNTGTADMPSIVLSQIYDGFGNRASINATMDSTDVFTNTYTHDALGEMNGVSQTGAGVSDKSATFGYNGIGQFTGMALFASTDDSAPIATTDFAYDLGNHLTSLTHTRSSDSSTIAAYGFTYDANGQITSLTNPDGSIAFTYDPDGRLTSASSAAFLFASYGYGYDASNNVRSNTLDGAAFNNVNVSSNNQLEADGTYTYAYDANGNLITKTTTNSGETQNFAWDYRNRLTDITYKDSGGTTTKHIHYTYDVFNRRISQSIDSAGTGTYDSVERYVYDGSNLAITLDGSGAVTHVFLNGPAQNQTLADDAGGGNVTWLLADQQGSVRDVLDSTGASINHIQYDPYGNLIAQSSPTDQPRFMYAGMQLDGTGLYFDNARYYDPATSKFISIDPAGFAGGSANLYGYVNADPVNFTDPSGLSPKGDALKHAATEAWDGAINFGENVAAGFTDVQVHPTEFKAKGWSGFAGRVVGRALGGLVGLGEIGGGAVLGGLSVLEDGSIVLAPVGVVQGLAGLALAGKGIKSLSNLTAPIEVNMTGEGGGDGENTFSSDESQLGHIFRDDEGHLPDTPENRQLLKDVANDPNNILGPDEFGNTWSAKTLANGTQVWTRTRNGRIINGGLNQSPQPYNPKTGLSSPTKPGR